jgi:hypothetical protein
LQPQGGGLFGAEGAYQNRAGPWSVSVYIRRRGMDDSLVETTVTVPEPVITTAPNQPWQNPISAWPPDALVVSVSIAVALWRRLTRSPSANA